MTTEEKKKILTDYCHARDCKECPLEFPNRFGCRLDNLKNMEDYEVAELFSLLPHKDETPTAPTILDSGSRREFETGSVRDMAEGKGRMDLLPWAAIMEVSKHCENGCKKYGAHNIDLGQNTSVLGDSAARHLAKWMEGWTDEPHLLAAAWNLLWAIQMELKRPDLCDVPWRPEK